MSTLFELQEKLQDTNAALAQLQKAVANDPQKKSLSAIRYSLEKRQRILQADFFTVAKQVGVDVCSYRGIFDGPAVKAAPIFGSVAEFQKVFSVTYDAEKNGPKARGTISKQIEAETAFGFGYAFMGSVGFVLTLPNERMLVGETHLDAAMNDLMGMARAKTSDEVLSYSHRLGVAPVNAVYNWAEMHAKNQLGADIEWRRQEEIKSKLFIQHQEFEKLRELIDHTSEETSEIINVTGTLVDVAHSHRSFKLEVEGGAIQGLYGDAIDPEHTVSIPGIRYNAVLMKTTKIYFSTGTEKVTYFLIKLSPVAT